MPLPLPLVMTFYIEFAVLLTISTGILLTQYELREHILVRLFASFLLIAAGTMLAVIIDAFVASTIEELLLSLLVSSIAYLIIFAAVSASALICFQGGFGSLLLCSIAGYAVKQIVENLILLVQLIPGVPNLNSLTFESILPVYLMRIPIYFATYVLLYFFVAKRLSRRTSLVETKMPVLICTIITILICFIFNMIRSRYAFDIVILDFTCIVYNLVCCLLVLFLYLGVLETNTYEQEVMTMQRVWKEQEAQLELFRESMDQIDVKYHDLKRSLRLLRAENTQYATQLFFEIEESLKNYDTKVETGNTTLDTILTQYRLQCEKNHIRFSMIVDGSLLAFVSSTDMVAFVGNILENAIEAVMKLPEERRSICFSVNKAMGLVCVHEENPFEEELVFKRGVPQTSKKNNKYHGFGIKSIQIVTKKYSGDMAIDASNGIFSITITFEM